MRPEGTGVHVLRESTRWPLAAAPGALRELIQKELKLKYKRSLLGFLWSMLAPVVLMCVYLFVFGRVFEAPQDDYALFLLCGLVPWHFFSLGLLAATHSLLLQRSLIQRINFPRALVPSTSVLANLVHFLAALACLLVLVVLTGRSPWLELHWLVLAIVLETTLCIGVGLALSVWNVRLRDTGQLIGMFVVVLFFATPVVYELSQVPDGYRALSLANPLTMIMEAYRSALYDGPSPDTGPLLISIGETALLFGFGLLLFSKRSPELPKEL